MNLSPPALTRSPCSPSNPYCSSESSSPNYPALSIRDQHYRLGSIHRSPQPCPMAQPLAITMPLSAMDGTSWASTATMMPSPLSPAPNILSADYDPFAHFDSPVLASCHDEYQVARPHAASIPTTHSTAGSERLSRSPPSPNPVRPSFTFATQEAKVPSPTPHLKVETTDGYGSVDVLEYPLAHQACITPGLYPPRLTPLRTHTAPYLNETQARSWPKPAEHDLDRLYPQELAGQHTTILPGPGRRSFRVARPPRRLTTREDANFQCEVKGCGKLFNRSYNFKAHMETHDEKRQYPFPCAIEGCAKRFVRKTDLQRHHQSVHMKERNHKCNYCGRLFARKDTLTRHMEDGCSRRFDISTMDLRSHLFGDSIGDRVPTNLACTRSYEVTTPGSLPPMATPRSPCSSLSTSNHLDTRTSDRPTETGDSYIWA